MAEEEMEEGAKEEIGAAEEKLGDLDAATAAAEVPAEPDGGEVAGVPDVTAPLPADSGDETPADELPVDGGDWSAQFVRDVGDEGILHALHLFERADVA